MTAPGSISNVTDFSGFSALRAKAQAGSPEALRQAAKQFEAMFTTMLLKSADQSKLGDDLTGENGDLYRDLYNQQLAQQLSAGSGLGLADMLVRQLRGLGHDSDSLAAAQGNSPRSSVGVPNAATSSVAGGGGLLQSAKDFVSSIRSYAEKAAQALGVPIRAVIAQAALETGWGQHVPKQSNGSTGNNLFGIKAGGSWGGQSVSASTTEYAGATASTQGAGFRTYPSLGHAFDDYVGVLKGNPRYAQAISSGNVEGFAIGLQRAGYATDPGYAQKIVDVANSPEMAAALKGPGDGGVLIDERHADHRRFRVAGLSRRPQRCLEQHCQRQYDRVQPRTGRPASPAGDHDDRGICRHRRSGSERAAPCQCISAGPADIGRKLLQSREYLAGVRVTAGQPALRQQHGVVGATPELFYGPQQPQR